MKKFALTAVTAAAFALAACGSADDASEDAMADNVEMPADDAMTGLPDPVADETTAAEVVDDEVVADTAESAADAAEAAVADIEAAEAAAEPAN